MVKDTPPRENMDDGNNNNSNILERLVTELESRRADTPEPANDSSKQSAIGVIVDAEILSDGLPTERYNSAPYIDCSFSNLAQAKIRINEMLNHRDSDVNCLAIAINVGINYDAEEFDNFLTFIKTTGLPTAINLHDNDNINDQLLKLREDFAGFAIYDCRPNDDIIHALRGLTDCAKNMRRKLKSSDTNFRVDNLKPARGRGRGRSRGRGRGNFGRRISDDGYGGYGNGGHGYKRRYDDGNDSYGYRGYDKRRRY